LRLAGDFPVDLEVAGDFAGLSRAKALTLLGEEFIPKQACACDDDVRIALQFAR